MLFFNFRHYVALKIVTCVTSYTGYPSLVKILLKFELIKADLSSLSSVQIIQTDSFEFIQTYFELIQDHFEYIQGLLSSFRVIAAHFGFRLIQALLGSFRLFRLIQAHSLDCSFQAVHLGSFQPIKYILQEITLIYILLTPCKLYAAAVISLQFTGKKVKCISIRFMIIIQFIFWRQCEIHQCQFQVPMFFSILFSTP